MNRFLVGTILLLFPRASLNAATLALAAPLDYQVVQRSSKTQGTIDIAGAVKDVDGDLALEARLVVDDKPGAWQRLTATFNGSDLKASMNAPAGGWYRLDVRVVKGDASVAETSVGHVGVGEIFVVAGQSNSANHGAERQRTKSQRVATFDGKRWQLCNDPQPGASGAGGSFLPPLGDELAEHFKVPVGFLSCGIGATSVREWMPKGTTFPNPPTIVGNVQQLPGGEWESKGGPYTMFTNRLKPLGPRGFRAVMWHQGESDANQPDPKRSLPGDLYRQHLERLIRDSRREIGWDAPWFVAQVSYHTPAEPRSDDIRSAQKSLWDAGIALEGPDSDALVGDLRERGGKGVHFSGKGLRAHAARWAEKVTPWLEKQLDAVTK